MQISFIVTYKLTMGDDTDAILAEMDKMMAEYENVVDNSTNVDGFKVGDTVEANYKTSDMWLKGRIAECHTDGSLDIQYADGEVEQAKAARDVRLVDTAPAKLASPALAAAQEHAEEQEQARVPAKVVSPKAASPTRPSPLKAAVAEDPQEQEQEQELQVLSEDEIREMSRHTTEDRNISVQASQEPLPVASRPEPATRTFTDTFDMQVDANTHREGHADEYDLMIADDGTGGGEYSDDEHDEAEELEQSRPGTASSSDYNRDGSLSLFGGPSGHAAWRAVMPDRARKITSSKRGGTQ